jgi:hypothetical protein
MLFWKRFCGSSSEISTYSSGGIPVISSPFRALAASNHSRVFKLVSVEWHSKKPPGRRQDHADETNSRILEPTPKSHQRISTEFSPNSSSKAGDTVSDSENNTRNQSPADIRTVTLQKLHVGVKAQSFRHCTCPSCGFLLMPAIVDA